MRFGADAVEAAPIIAVVFVAAALLALVLTPLARRAALRYGVVDRPDPRRVNPVPIPRGGGLAAAAAFVIVGLGVVAVALWSTVLPVGRIGPLTHRELFALIAGGALAAGLGALDDYFDLRARWQFLAQLVLAFFVVALGIGVDVVNNPFGPGVIRLDGAFEVGFTVVWVLGMINSINFIDGLDGLSAGVAIIAAVTLGLINLTTGIDQPQVAIFCFVFAGAVLGFLRWNFNPATVFAGTSGVFFFGFTLALLSILGTAKIAVALLVLAVPIIDTFWIIVRRLASGRSPFSPDRGHIHHRLLDLGLSQRQTVLAIYAICILLAALTFFLSGTGQMYVFLAVVVGFGLLLVILTRRSPEEESLRAEAYVDDPDLPGDAGGDPTSGA
jgi:UDP-GlcNAc:undecaprenyl-phosphate/decaprenyl-phosphate GlcNAc-1-phosphate transferase